MHEIHLNASHCVWDAGAILGEGPAWSATRRSLFWVDIKAPALHRLGLDDHSRESWPMPERIGFAVERANGAGFIVGLKHRGFALLDLPSGQIHHLGHPEPEHPDNRFNDAKADPAGRLWAGTMDDQESTPSGWLYRLDPGGSWSRHDGPYVVTNGPAIDPSRQILYHTDSANRSIYAFDLQTDGSLANKRRFATLSPAEGFPDGMTVDSQGGLWVAHFGGSRVSCYTPDGQLERLLHLPVSQVTSCCFAGDHLKQLFITSASVGLDEASRAREPLAGGLFMVEPGVQGLPTQQFAG